MHCWKLDDLGEHMNQTKSKFRAPANSETMIVINFNPIQMHCVLLALVHFFHAGAMLKYFL